MRLSSRPSSIPPSAAEIFEAVRNLRGELEQTKTPEERAVLLHEIGVLEELHKDDHGAANDLLGAVNAMTALREPLEHLIALMERRHSLQNLGKLLDRLGRVANTPDEIVRAQLARGDFASDQRRDDEAARQAYSIAEQAGVEQNAVWLSLEFLAGKLGDRELLRRVVGARAARATDPTYRALLRLRAAEVTEAGDEAVQILEELAALPGPARERALFILEQQAELRGERQRVAELRESRAQHFTQLLENPDPTDGQGSVQPHLARALATELWLRAARDRCALADTDRALANLARAERLLGNNPAVLYALVDVHAMAGNAVGVTRAVTRLLQILEPSGTSRATPLWLAALAEAERNNHDEASIGLRRVLEADPQSVPARALELELLVRKDDQAGLAEAFDSIAQTTTDDRSRVRCFSLAALAHGQAGPHTDAARAALSQATLAGLDPRTACRMSRVLAALGEDAHWYREASSRLLSTASKAEQALEERHGAWLELARLAWLRADPELAREAIEGLAAEPEGAWLAAILSAYQPTSAEAAGSASTADDAASALLRLSEVSDADVATGLRQIVALRRQRRGQLDEARELLDELHRSAPADVIVAAQLARVLRQEERPLLAAAVLSDTSDATATPDVALGLKLKAGILTWLGGDRETAVDHFEAAALLNANASSGLLQWALRAARPDAPDARRKALDVALENTGDRDVYALERFALGVGQPATHLQATEGLDAADEVSLGDSGGAVQLARALWRESSQHDVSLRHLEARSERGKEIARSVRFLELRSKPTPDPQELCQLAESWAKTGSVAGTLEWLAAAIGARDVGAEITARQALSKHLEGEAQAANDAGTALLRLLHEDRPPPLLDSHDPQARLANLETSPPGCDPRRRARALTAAGELLGDEQEVLNLALAGYNELLAQRHDAALASFRAVVSNLPEDIGAWEGLRLAAQHLELRDTEADACLRLGQLSKTPVVAARFFREAAQLLLDELGRTEEGEQALKRATELDISHKRTFKRWYSVLRGRGDDRGVVELLARRISATNDASELVTLYWDRARAFRQLDELESALEELQNLSLLDSSHVGARALRGEIFIRQGAFAAAASELAELCAMDQAPDEQRLMSGVAAVDLYESKLNDLSKALEVLDVLQARHLDTLAVRERLARAAAKTERWEDAARLLEQLVIERQTASGRIDAARLLLAIARDQLKRPERARTACEALLQEAPTDPEAIDFVLEGVFGEAESQSLLTRMRAALLKAPLDDLDSEQVARIARVAEQLDDLSLRQAALGALVTLGVNNHDLRDELRQLDQRTERHPQIALGDLETSGLLHPEDTGPIAELLQVLAPYLPRALGPTLETLGVGRRERQKPPMAATLRAELSAFAGAFGLNDFDLYVGGAEPRGVIAVPDPKLPAFVVGADVHPPLSPRLRWSLMQQALGLARGTSVLLQRDTTDVAALLTAACRLVGVELSVPAFAMLPQFERLLDKTLPRRLRKTLAPIAAQIAREGRSPLAWAQAARSSLDRAAVAAVGDASWVLLDDKERETQERHFEGSAEERVWRIVRFALSEDFAQLRAKLGMAPR